MSLKQRKNEFKTPLLDVGVFVIIQIKCPNLLTDEFYMFVRKCGNWPIYVRDAIYMYAQEMINATL